MSHCRIYWNLPLMVALLLFGVLFAGTGMAQDGKVSPDNKGPEIVSGLLHDTAAINKEIRAASKLKYGSVEDPEGLYQNALVSSKLLRYSVGIYKSLFGLATYYSNKNEYDKAISYAHLAMSYCGNDTAGHEMVSRLDLILSDSYYYKGRYDSCAYFRYAALNELEANHIGNEQMRLKVYTSILEFWLNAHEDIRHDPYIQQVMQQIKVLEQNAQTRGDKEMLMNIYFYEGGYYSNIGSNDSARYYCNLNLELARMLKSNHSILAGTLINIGLTWLDEKQNDSAIAYFEKGMAEIPMPVRNTSRQLIFGKIFLGEAYGQKKDYQTAIATTLPALREAQEMHITHITDHAYKTLADAYFAVGEYKKSADYLKLYADVRDSLMKAEKLELVYNVEMKYRIADKNKELAQKELAIAGKESRIRAKNFLIAGISAASILLLLVSMLLYRYNHQKQKLQTEKIRNLRQEMEIGSLQAMIAGEEKERSRIARELHDGLGGLLGIIRTRVSLIFRKHREADVSGDFTEVLKWLEEASTDLRKTAHNLMPEILLQEGLVTASSLFCERVRKGHTLEISFETWGDVQRLPTEFELAVYRIIQELVHNILKHAKANNAVVQIVFHDHQLCLTVEDDGNGMLDGHSEGMGLRSIRERVHSMNGQVDVASHPGKGTSVYIELAIKKTTQEIWT